MGINCAQLLRDIFFKLTGEMSYRIKLRMQSSPDQKSPSVKVLLIAFIGASLTGVASGGLLTGVVPTSVDNGVFWSLNLYL